LIERDEEFQSLFGNHRLLAFHSTSLFDHEVEQVRTSGLRRLSPELVEQKISAAFSREVISEEQREHCLNTNVYAIDNEQYRENQICLVLGRSIFDDLQHGPGLHSFLGGWGGEAINGGPSPDEDPVLGSLGRPSIVVAAIDLGIQGGRPYAAPALAKVFVGKRLGLGDAFGEIYVKADIPGERILDIWHPGDPDYDRHSLLPGERGAEAAHHD
jgi:hypothetical protein